MESSGSSFIPQRPTRGKVAAKSFRKIYVLSYVSYLIFFTTLLAVAGVFFYKLSLQSQLQGLKEELVAQKNLFAQADLDRIRTLDNRIDAAVQLVNSHASLLTIFNALSQNVADPIQFLTFNYDRREDVRTPVLTLSAQARNFDEVIFQQSVFANAQLTNNLYVNNINLVTQPVNQERLELGVEQVVNVNMSVELALSDVNFTGYVARPAEGGGLTLPPDNADSDSDAMQSAASDNGFETADTDTQSDSDTSAVTSDTPVETEAVTNTTTETPNPSNGSQF